MVICEQSSVDKVLATVAVYVVTDWKHISSATKQACRVHRNVNSVGLTISQLLALLLNANKFIRLKKEVHAHAFEHGKLSQRILKYSTLYIAFDETAPFSKSAARCTTLTTNRNKAEMTSHYSSVLQLVNSWNNFHIYDVCTLWNCCVQLAW